MGRIVSLFMSRHMSTNCIAAEEEEADEEAEAVQVKAVAELWDEYLAQVVADPALSARRLVGLLDITPPSARPSHDRLYAVIDSFLQTHSNVSQQEREEVVCKTLNCQKLSKECCLHAVQNERMPLRIIVQAMFMHQLMMNSSTSFGSSSNGARNTTNGAAPTAAILLRRSTSCHQSIVPTQQQDVRTSTKTKGRQQQQVVVGSALHAATTTTTTQSSSMEDVEVLRSRLLSLEEEIHNIKKGLACFSLHTSTRAPPSPPAATKCHRHFSCLGILRHHIASRTPPPPPPPPLAAALSTDGQDASANNLHIASPLAPNKISAGRRSHHSF